MAKHPFKKPPEVKQSEPVVHAPVRDGVRLSSTHEPEGAPSCGAASPQSPVAGPYRCGAQHEGKRCYLHVGHDGEHDFDGEKIEPVNAEEFHAGTEAPGYRPSDLVRAAESAKAEAPWGPAPKRFDPMAQASVGPTLEEQERVTDEMMKQRLAAKTGNTGTVELTREDLEQAFKDYEAASVKRLPLERKDALEMLRLMKVGMGLVLVQTGHTAYIPEIDAWQSAVEKLIAELGGAA